jgi:NADH-ubiquinone oxidoreductase chain 4L
LITRTIGLSLFLLRILTIFLLKIKKIKKNNLMIKHTMNLSLILFLIGILGFVLNRKNVILMLISIEIMLLAITFLILISSLSFDDILGQTYAVYIIAIAGAESAIGLGILVAFYRLRGSISIEYK